MSTYRHSKVSVVRYVAYYVHFHCNLGVMSLAYPRRASGSRGRLNPITRSRCQGNSCVLGWSWARAGAGDCAVVFLCSACWETFRGPRTPLERSAGLRDPRSSIATSEHIWKMQNALLFGNLPPAYPFLKVIHLTRYCLNKSWQLPVYEYICQHAMLTW